jgi:hypothetical protein
MERTCVIEPVAPVDGLKWNLYYNIPQVSHDLILGKNDESVRAVLHIISILHSNVIPG